MEPADSSGPAIVNCWNHGSVSSSCLGMSMSKHCRSVMILPCFMQRNIHSKHHNPPQVRDSMDRSCHQWGQDRNSWFGLGVRRNTRTKRHDPSQVRHIVDKDLQWQTCFVLFYFYWGGMQEHVGGGMQHHVGQDASMV